MDYNYDDITLLERYIEQSLTEEERIRVERRLAEEPSLKELYRQEKLLVKGIRYGHLKSKLEDLRALESTLASVQSKENKGKVIFLKTYWKAMAAAAALVVTVGLFLMISRPMSPQALYAQYYAHYPNIFKGTTRGGNVGVQEEAYGAYDARDFAKAAEGFNKMWKNKESLDPKDRPGVLLLLGNANLMLGRTEEARDNFITLSKDFDELDDQAQWFLSLCYLKMENKDSAKVLLEEIAGGRSSYREKAREVLKKLK